MRYIPLFALFFALISPAFSMGPKIPKATVTFHTEASEHHNPKMIFPYQAPGGDKYFQRVPVSPTKEIIHYSPFPADDGSIGAVFKFNPVGTRRLNAVTTEAQSKWMMAVINGRPTNVVFIDKPVRDGVMVVWTGLKQRDIDLIDLEIPRKGVNKKDWQKKKKEIRKRVKRQIKNAKSKKKNKS